MQALEPDRGQEPFELARGAGVVPGDDRRQRLAVARPAARRPRRRWRPRCRGSPWASGSSATTRRSTETMAPHRLLGVQLGLIGAKHAGGRRLRRRRRPECRRARTPARGLGWCRHRCRTAGAGRRSRNGNRRFGSLSVHGDASPAEDRLAAAWREEADRLSRPRARSGRRRPRHRRYGGRAGSRAGAAAPGGRSGPGSPAAGRRPSAAPARASPSAGRRRRDRRRRRAARPGRSRSDCSSRSRSGPKRRR